MIDVDQELNDLQRRWENAKTLRAKHRIELMMERAAARALGKPTDGERAETLATLSDWRRAIEVGP